MNLTPEKNLMMTLVLQQLIRGLIQREGDKMMLDFSKLDAIAAPLEAANARIAELERELAEAKSGEQRGRGSSVKCTDFQGDGAVKITNCLPSEAMDDEDPSGLVETMSRRIAELEAERDKLRTLYDTAWAECQAWRSAFRASECACLLGMSDRDATCATHDYLRREAGEVQQ